MSEEIIISHLLAGTIRDGICRICFSESDELQPICETVVGHENISIKEMLLNISAMEVSNADSLPERVCPACLEKIFAAYSFRLQCEESEIILKNCITCLYEQVLDISASANNSSDKDTILIVLPESKNEDGEINLFKNTINNNMIPNEAASEDVINLSAINDDFKEEMKDSDAELNFLDVLGIQENDLSAIQADSLPDDDCDPNNDFIKTQPKNKAIMFHTERNKQAIKRLRNGHDCTKCFNTFSTWEQLKLHEKSHSENARHVCRICHRSYRKASILKRHIVTHTGRRGFVCNICGKSFYHRNALKAHIRYHQEKKYVCRVCQKKFYFRHMLFDHINTHHPSEASSYGDQILNDIKDECNSEEDVSSTKVKTEFDCTMCLETFSSNEELKVHIFTHPEGTRHICRVCGKSYLEVGTLKRHMVVHTGKKSYLCTVCGKSFFYRNILKAHMIYHSEKSHGCTKCEKKFHTRHILQEHVRLAHSQDKYSFMCEVCGKLCSSRSRLLIHKDSHSKICCPKCGKSYKNMRYFKAHQLKHEGLLEAKKSFICDYCGEERNLKTLLELHILSKHLQERRYKCHICNKGFFSKGSLNEHGIVHTRERPVQCEICDRRFVNKKALMLHNRLHTGEKPYPCSICGERFLSSSRRRVHEKKHGERTEHCPWKYCNSKFHNRSDLRKHWSLHMKKIKQGQPDTLIEESVLLPL